MSKILTVLLLACFFAIASCMPNGPKSHNQYVLTGLNIVDTETGSIHMDQSIVIKNEEIAEIFEDGTQTPAADTVINMDEKYVIPGLWDMHIHLRGGTKLASSNKKLLPLFPAHGVTTVRDAGGDLTSSVIEWKQQIEKDTMTGPFIFTSGPKLDGPNGTWEGSLEVENKADVSIALDSLQSLNADYVKIYDSQLSAQAYMEIVRQAEQRGLKTTGHMPMTVLINDALEAGLDGIEHLYYVMKGASTKEAEIALAVQHGDIGFWTAVQQLLNSYDEAKAKAFYQKLKAHKVAVVPTLYIDDVLSYLHEENHSEDDFLKYIPQDIQQTYNRRLNSAQQRDQQAITFEERLNQHFKKITKDLHDAGVTILAGSDAGAYNSFVYPGQSLHKELQALQAAGLSSLEALQTATIHASKFFSGHNRPGNITKGKAADLLILNQNPLDDISNTTRIHAVIKNGRFLNESELKGILE